MTGPAAPATVSEVRAYYPSGRQLLLPCHRWLGYRLVPDAAEAALPEAARAVPADPVGSVFVQVEPDGPRGPGSLFALDPRAWVVDEATGATRYDPWDNPFLPAVFREWLGEHPEWLSSKPRPRPDPETPATMTTAPAARPSAAETRQQRRERARKGHRR